jgi:hypothetical protein
LRERGREREKNTTQEARRGGKYKENNEGLGAIEVGDD